MGYFESFGPIEDWSFRGHFAFLTFENPGDTDKCLDKGEQHSVRDLKFHVRISDSKKAKKKEQLGKATLIICLALSHTILFPQTNSTKTKSLWLIFRANQII